MKVRNKISLPGIIISLMHHLHRLYSLGCMLLLAACTNAGEQFIPITDPLEEVLITSVNIEKIEPATPSESIQLGEQIILDGSYNYVGDDHRCHWAWIATFPDGIEYADYDEFFPTERVVLPVNSFVDEEIITVNESDCITELRFAPQIAGAYEIEYLVVATGYNVDGEGFTKDSKTYSFTVVAPPCQFFDLVVSPEEVTVAPGTLASFSVFLENVSDDWVPHSIIGGERAINFSLRQINDAGEPVEPLGLGVVNGIGYTGGLNRENTEGSFRPRIEDNAPAGTYRFVVTPNGGPEEDICFSNEFVIIVEED